MEKLEEPQPVRRGASSIAPIIKNSNPMLHQQRKNVWQVLRKRTCRENVHSIIVLCNTDYS